MREAGGDFEPAAPEGAVSGAAGGALTGDGARVGTEGGDGGPAVAEGGPGDRAGFRAGDVITEVDGRRIHSGDELIVKTRAHRPGDRLTLTAERDGRQRTVALVRGSSDGD